VPVAERGQELSHRDLLERQCGAAVRYNLVGCESTDMVFP
jgi:hypothetical protein